MRRALERAGIPHRYGLLVARSPVVVFTVPEERLDEARAALAEDHDDEDAGSVPLPAAPRPFPWHDLALVGALVLVHFALVAALAWAGEEVRYTWLRRGALARGATLVEPWRLVTAMLLHSDAPHAFWNGVSMTVFALPLLADLRWAWTARIYLAAGIGGGIAGLAASEPGSMIIGSSGAVAGLFGAWVVLTLRRARLAELPARARWRGLGIAMLMLPSLLSPVSSTGHPISVGSHLGGLATGMAIGALISRGLIARAAPAPPL